MRLALCVYKLTVMQAVCNDKRVMCLSQGYLSISLYNNILKKSRFGDENDLHK